MRRSLLMLFPVLVYYASIHCVYYTFVWIVSSSLLCVVCFLPRKFPGCCNSSLLSASACLTLMLYLNVHIFLYTFIFPALFSQYVLMPSNHLLLFFLAKGIWRPFTSLWSDLAFVQAFCVAGWFFSFSLPLFFKILF